MVKFFTLLQTTLKLMLLFHLLLTLCLVTISQCVQFHILYSSKNESGVHVVPVSHINICVSFTFNQASPIFYIIEQPNPIQKD